jgi:hypothetical protein
MSGRWVLPRWGDLRTRAALWAGVAVLGVAAALVLPVTYWFRSREASAGMLAPPAQVDGARAYKYLKQVCDLGPHPAGSEVNTKVRKLVAKHFEEQKAKVREQPFTGADPRTGKRVNMVNLIGSWHPERRDRVVIGAHYDSRPFPDEDKDPEKRRTPFLGANDPGSGIALLMELAHHLDTLETAWGVDLVLFDGEELVYGGGDQQLGEYFLGSKEFARKYDQMVQRRSPPYRYHAGIVLDMVGGRDLSIDQEENSLNLAPGLVREVWRVARQVNAHAFRPQVGQAVLDDHLPLNNAGIPTIDLIDWEAYRPYWHTSQDLPDRCSAASLEQVGRVVTTWLALPRRKR